MRWIIVAIGLTSGIWFPILYRIGRRIVVPPFRNLQDYWEEKDPSELWQSVRKKMDEQIELLKDVRFDDLVKYAHHRVEFLVDDRRAEVGIKTHQPDDLTYAVYIYGWLRYYNDLERPRRYKSFGYVRRRDGSMFPLSWRGRFFMRNLTSGSS